MQNRTLLSIIRVLHREFRLTIGSPWPRTPSTAVHGRITESGVGRRHQCAMQARLQNHAGAWRELWCDPAGLDVAD